MLPPWKEIYVQDDVRYESFEEATEIYKEIIKVYDLFEMNPIILNKGTLNQRVEKILEIIK